MMQLNSSTSVGVYMDNFDTDVKLTVGLRIVLLGVDINQLTTTVTCDAGPKKRGSVDIWTR